MTPHEKPVVVTVSANSLPASSEPGVILTPAGQPNVYLKVIEPVTIVGVRALRTFLQTLLGLLTAGLISPTTLGASDFGHLLLTCASLSVAPAVICIIQNVIELMAKFDQSHPTMTS